MVVDIVGYQSLNFKDQNDPSRIVTGYNVYYPEPIRDRGAGTAYVKKFVPLDRVVGAISLGKAEFDIQLSMSGKPFVQSLSMVPDAKAVTK